MAELPCLKLNRDAILDSVRGATKAAVNLTGFGIMPGSADKPGAAGQIAQNGALVAQNLVQLALNVGKAVEQAAEAINLVGDILGAPPDELAGVSPIAYDDEAGEISHEAVAAADVTEIGFTDKVLARVGLTAKGHLRTPVEADFDELPPPTPPHYHLATATEDYDSYTDEDAPTVKATIDGVEGEQTVILLFRGTYASSIEYPNIRQSQKFHAFQDSAGTWYSRDCNDAPVNGPGNVVFCDLNTEPPPGWERITSVLPEGEDPENAYDPRGYLLGILQDGNVAWHKDGALKHKHVIPGSGDWVCQDNPVVQVVSYNQYTDETSGRDDWPLHIELPLIRRVK
ncbi:MAG TPA: hypothetical protein VM695_10185 [Phycisphaerae bacterium]|nr:hypothetical protein [Phycisphaerae bacterium]